MEQDIKVRLSKIKRYEDFNFIKTFVEISFKHEDAGKFWFCEMEFMIDESDKTVKEIEKEAFARARKFLKKALNRLDTI